MKTGVPKVIEIFYAEVYMKQVFPMLLKPVAQIFYDGFELSLIYSCKCVLVEYDGAGYSEIPVEFL